MDHLYSDRHTACIDFVHLLVSSLDAQYHRWNKATQAPAVGAVSELSVSVVNQIQKNGKEDILIKNGENLEVWVCKLVQIIYIYIFETLQDCQMFLQICKNIENDVNVTHKRKKVSM